MTFIVIHDFVMPQTRNIKLLHGLCKHLLLVMTIYLRINYYFVLLFWGLGLLICSRLSFYVNVFKNVFFLCKCFQKCFLSLLNFFFQAFDLLYCSCLSSSENFFKRPWVLYFFLSSWCYFSALVFYLQIREKIME